LACTRQFRACSAWLPRHSKAAGVAEGTLFTHFSNKEILMNEIYRELKIELAEAIMTVFPLRCAKPGENEGDGGNYACPIRLPKKTGPPGLRINDKLIRDYPVDFIGAMFSGLAETTMVYMESSKKKTAQITVPPASKPYGAGWL
jgi:AcrR family transcriptional regulator